MINYSIDNYLMTTILAIVFAGMVLLSNISFADETSKDLFEKIAEQYKSSNKVEKLYPLIEQYINSNMDVAYLDDVLLIKATMLSDEKRYKLSNEVLDRITKFNLFLLVEPATLEIERFPAELLKSDVLSYINYIRAENFIGLKNYGEAQSLCEEILLRIKNDQLVMSNEKDVVYSIYYNLVQIYRYNKMKNKAKMLIREYIDKEYYADDAQKKQMLTLYDKLSIRDRADRNPFAYPGMNENVVREQSKQRNIFVNEKYFLTGIVNEEKKYVIIEYKGNSYVKSTKSKVNGYNILKISENYILLRKPGSAKVIKLKVGDGHSL